MSNNLNLAQVVASQDQKEVTINLQAGQLDAAISSKLEVEIDNTNAALLANEHFQRNFLFHVIPAATIPTAGITLTVPAVARGSFAVLNTTAQIVTVTVAGQPVAAPEVESGSDNPSLFTCDGVNVRLASSAGSGSAGDVVGPASSTDGHVVLFDGTTGKLVKSAGRGLHGTTPFNKVVAGNIVGAGATVNFNLTSYFNRGFIHTIKITETGGTTVSTYDVKLFGKDTFLAADLHYSVTGIDPAAASRVYLDDLLVFYSDKDGTDELHLQVTNTDATNGMTFTLEIDAEVSETGIGGGGGDVVGPASAISGNIPSFDGTTGKLIADGGKVAADLVTGPVSSVDASLVLFDGLTGKVIKDSGRVYVERDLSFTVDLRFGGLTTGITYAARTFRYTRIGDLVHVSGNINLTSKGTATGNATITLPIVPDGGVPGFMAIPHFSGMASLRGMVIGKVESSQAHIVMFHPNAADGTATGMSTINDSNFTDTSTIQFTGMYRVAP